MKPSLNYYYYCSVGRNSSRTTAHCVLDHLTVTALPFFSTTWPSFLSLTFILPRAGPGPYIPNPRKASLSVISNAKRIWFEDVPAELANWIIFCDQKLSLSGKWAYLFISLGAAVYLMSWGQKMNAGLDLYSLCCFILWIFKSVHNRTKRDWLTFTDLHICIAMYSYA